MYGNGTFIATGRDMDGGTLYNVISFDEGASWTREKAWLDPVGSMGRLRRFAYGGKGVFAATCMAESSHIILMSRSTNSGRTWSACEKPIASSSLQHWEALSGDGNGTFVAVTDSSSSGDLGKPRSMKSTDAGITWTQYATCDDSQKWFAITNGNGVFVALADPDPYGTNANTMRSTNNGETWSCQSPPNGVKFNYDSTSITYGNGIFVATTFDGTMRSTNDGVSWTSQKTNDGKEWRSVTYGNGVFVAVTRTDGAVIRTMSSTDGITWTGLPGAPDDARWDSVAYGGGKFLALGRSNLDNAGFGKADIKMMTHPGDTF